MNQTKVLVSFLVVTFFFSFAYSQSNQNDYEYSSLFDTITGSNNLDVYNGLLYNDEFRNTQTNFVFFKNHTFSKEIITFNNQTYDNVLLKYDIYNDVLLSKLNTEKNYLNIQLISDKISKFTIDKHHFVKTPKDLQINFLNTSGFIEKVFQGKHLTLYIKHHKKDKRNLERRRVDSDFVKESVYLMQHEGKYYKIGSISDLTKIFNSLKKDIKTYRGKNKSMQKNNLDEFMTLLIIEIDTKLL